MREERPEGRHDSAKYLGVLLTDLIWNGLSVPNRFSHFNAVTSFLCVLCLIWNVLFYYVLAVNKIVTSFFTRKIDERAVLQIWLFNPLPVVDEPTMNT